MPAASRLKRIDRSKLLLGEGVDEVRFFESLFRHLGLTDVQVADTGGKDNMRAVLKTLPRLPRFPQLTSLGVARDADSDAAAAFQSVCDSLKRAGLDSPGVAGGSANGPPRVSVFILPDCKSKGMLETLCFQSIAGDTAIKCVDQYFECVKQAANRAPSNMDKARVHAWLASQVQPDKRLGEAAEARLWPWEDPAFNKLKAFLRNL